MISHELKTPLTPLVMWADALKEPGMLGTLNPNQIDAINKISNSSIQLKKLINDMFDAYKLDLNQLQFRYSDFDVKEMMDEIYKNCNLNDNKEIQLINNTEREIFVNSDKDRIMQVIQNFINNALDFVEPEKRIIIINAVDRGQTIEFSVKDNGIGIPEKEQEKIFTKFYQKDTSVTREHGGSVLGLAVCKGIVEGLGGKI